MKLSHLLSLLSVRDQYLVTAISLRCSSGEAQALKNGYPPPPNNGWHLGGDMFFKRSLILCSMLVSRYGKVVSAVILRRK